MKKTYMLPIMKMEYAQPTNIICTSIKSDDDTGLIGGGGSSEGAHTKEWDIWGDED